MKTNRITQIYLWVGVLIRKPDVHTFKRAAAGITRAMHDPIKRKKLTSMTPSKPKMRNKKHIA